MKDAKIETDDAAKTFGDNQRKAAMCF